MTERILDPVQSAEMGFVRGVHGVTLRAKVRSCEIGKTLNVQQHFFRSQLPDAKNCPRKDWRGKFCW